MYALSKEFTDALLQRPSVYCAVKSAQQTQTFDSIDIPKAEYQFVIQIYIEFQCLEQQRGKNGGKKAAKTRLPMCSLPELQCTLIILIQAYYKKKKIYILTFRFLRNIYNVSVSRVVTKCSVSWVVLFFMEYIFVQGQRGKKCLMLKYYCVSKRATVTN